MTPEIEQFGKCLYATDCLMDTNMRSFLNEDNAVATFIHQMVPHHNNAVNMAKILLKMDVLDPEDEDDAGMIDMLWAIINAQNYQNHNMEAYLDAKGLPPIGDAQCSADSAMWHKTGETASEKGCEWVAMFPEKRCLVKGCMDMGQEGAEGTDCPAEKYTACDGCMTTCANQMVCGGTGDDGKKPSGDDRK